MANTSETVDGKAAEQPREFEIPDYNMPVVERKIAALNKRAAKLGAEPVRIVVLKKWENRIILGDGDDPARFMGKDDITTMTLQPVKVIPMTTIQVIGTAPKLNGWTLVSVVEPVEGGVLLRKFPGVDLEIPVEFRDVSPSRCDHCHTSRQRNETFIVHHDGGDWKVVGRTCLADFTGTNSPERIANYASALFDFMLSIKDDEDRLGIGGGGNGGYYCAPMRSFLKMVAIYSARHGFVTATQAKKHNETTETDDYLTPTGKDVFRLFFEPNMYRSADRKKFYESITEDENQDSDDLVDAAMQWGKTQFVEAEEEKLTDYGHNMKLLLAADYVRIIDVGFVASVIPGYKRSLQPKRERLQGKGHVGEVGKKITLPVTVKQVHDWTGKFGLAHITTMVDDDGNLLTWFAPGKLEAMKEGTYKVMTAKVKRHDERDGIKSTIVNYCEFV
jgi:hypothetical protein